MNGKFCKYKKAAQFIDDFFKQHSNELPDWKEMRVKYGDAYYDIDNQGLYCCDWNDDTPFTLSILRDVPQNLTTEVVSTVSQIINCQYEKSFDYDMLMYDMWEWNLEDVGE